MCSGGDVVWHEVEQNLSWDSAANSKLAVAIHSPAIQLLRLLNLQTEQLLPRLLGFTYEGVVLGFIVSIVDYLVSSQVSARNLSYVPMLLHSV